MTRPTVNEVKGGSRKRSSSRCSQCGADLWLAPGSEATPEDVLELHVDKHHPEHAEIR